MRNITGCARTRDSRGFTLIEVLVVVAIIALLISILLPSLATARASAQLSACLGHMKQMSTACWSYASANNGYMPGARGGMNWLGRHNSNSGPVGQPDAGTLFRYVGRNRGVYLCPIDKPTPDHSEESLPAFKREYFFSYTMNIAMIFAKAENYAGAHYRKFDYNNQDHSNKNLLIGMDGTPVMMEEGLLSMDRRVRPISGASWETRDNDGRFVDGDYLTQRHLAGKGKDGRASIGYLDGHAGSLAVKSPPGLTIASGQEDTYFRGKSLCVRTKGGKYINVKAYNVNSADLSESQNFAKRADDTVALGWKH